MFNNIITQYDLPHADRIIVIADIHGDLKRFKNILINSKIINNELEWIAVPSNTIIIQLGDQIDSLNRIPDMKEWEIIKDIEMLHFTNSLDNIAKSKGGRMISLIGNHELMNIMGDFTYVSNNSSFSYRKDYFKPGGELSLILSKRPIVVKIGTYIFSHSCITKNHIDILESYNKDIFYLNELWYNIISNNLIKKEELNLINKILLNNDGILWNRKIAEKTDIEELLKLLNCNQMFIGHNLVDNIILYNEYIWFVDNGISRSFNKNNYEYIEIINNNINVITITD